VPPFKVRGILPRVLIFPESGNTTLRLTFLFFFVSTFVPLRAQLLHSFLKSIDEAEVIAGPALVSFDGLTFSQYNRTKVGYTIGIAANWSLVRRLTISAKFLYERKGVFQQFQANYQDPMTLEIKKGEVKDIWNFDYLSLPITLRYDLNRKRNFFWTLVYI
jgi:hypothetical protein